MISWFGETHWKSKTKTSKHYFSESGLKINPKKCKFAVTKIIFNGNILSAEGISPDPEKIKSINQLQVPTNLTEIKSLLGASAINSSQIINNHSSSSCIPSAPLFAFYNPNAATKIYVDSSPQRLGGSVNLTTAKW